MIEVKSCKDVNGNTIHIGDTVGYIDFDKNIVVPSLIVERITKEGYFITIHTNKRELYTKMQVILMHRNRKC